MRTKSLAILVPVYNSESTIGPLVDVIAETLSGHFERIEIILVNDGSPDNSHQRVLETMQRHPGMVKYIRLARNFGEHNAVMCGLRYVTAGCVAIIDDDFQNPPGEILKLVNKLDEGYEVVYSYYDRKEHHWFRNAGSKFNDWMATKLLKKPKGLYLSSFKVMSRFLVDEVIRYKGPYPYIDGLILRTTNAIGTQLCEHRSRQEGRSNYTLRRLIRLWLNMSTSFSVAPLRFSSILGLAMSAFGFLLTIFFILSWWIEGKIMGGTMPPGWASIIVSVTMFAGIQLCVLGVIGEYVGRLFLTENRQPQSVVRHTYGIPGEPHAADEQDAPSGR